MYGLKPVPFTQSEVFRKVLRPYHLADWHGNSRAGRGLERFCALSAKIPIRSASASNLGH